MAWKMFAIIFTFSFILAYVAAEIPSYIHVCNRKDPNLDKCIIDTLNNLRDYICNGIPELQSPPIEPFNIDNIIISDADNAKLYIKDAKITGLCDYHINSLHMDVDKLHLDTNVLFKKVYLNGTYDFDIHVLIPFVHQGPVYLSTDNLIAKIVLDMKTVHKDDKTYIYISKINLNLDIKTLDSKFEGNEKDSSQLNDILSTFLGSNEEELISRVKPSIQKEMSKQLLLLGNNIVKQFTFDELFPDRT